MNAGLLELLKSAVMAGAAAFMLALPVAWWLARRRDRLAAVARAALLIPVIVPSAAITLWFGVSAGYVGAVVFSVPFAVFPLLRAFSTTSKNSLDAAASLGASPLQRVIYLGLAPSLGAVLGGVGLTLARAFAELGTYAPSSAGGRPMGVAVLGLISLALLAVCGLGNVERRESRV